MLHSIKFEKRNQSFNRKNIAEYWEFSVLSFPFFSFSLPREKHKNLIIQPRPPLISLDRWNWNWFELQQHRISRTHGEALVAIWGTDKEQFEKEWWNRQKETREKVSREKLLDIYRSRSGFHDRLKIQYFDWFVCSHGMSDVLCGFFLGDFLCQCELVDFLWKTSSNFPANWFPCAFQMKMI